MQREFLERRYRGPTLEVYFQPRSLITKHQRQDFVAFGRWENPRSGLPHPGWFLFSPPGFHSRLWPGLWTATQSEDAYRLESMSSQVSLRTLILMGQGPTLGTLFNYNCFLRGLSLH